MINVALVGKEYSDHLFTIDNLIEGETNPCKIYQEKLGGVYNFLQIDTPSVKFKVHTSGKKKAFIVNDTAKSVRTSITVENEISSIDLDFIGTINSNYSWCHVSYLDDFEDYKKLLDIDIPLSIDFCTINSRKIYSDILNKAEIIFDSRERKLLYCDFAVKTPIIFHDPEGIEVHKNGKILGSDFITPLQNLEVNGAGDIFAAFFIKNYTKLGIIESASTAMRSTTDFLSKERRHSEKEI